MVFEGIGFNAAFWKTKSESEFIRHEKHHGLSEEKMKEAYALMNPKKESRDQPVNTDRAPKRGN